MLRRVNPIVLLSFIAVLVLSLGILAGARGGTAQEAVGVGEAQLGKPFVMATDGPDTFSCVGLMRHILRTIGVDANAPWSPEAYLGTYAPVDLANLQPGDIVIYPGWATMYVGNGTVLNANEMEGVVTHTSMDVAGTPLGAVRPPYGGSQPPTAGGDMVNDPAAFDPAAVDPAVADQAPPVDFFAADDSMGGGAVPMDVPVADPIADDSMGGGAVLPPIEVPAAEPMAVDTPAALDPVVAPAFVEEMPVDPALPV